MPIDRYRLTLDPDRYDAFMQALDNPPAPGPKLKALLKRVPAWETSRRLPSRLWLKLL